MKLAKSSCVGKLTITTEYEVTVQDILDNLACPGLETLIMSLSGRYQSFSLPATGFPTLRKIKYLYHPIGVQSSAVPMDSRNWNLLVTMMERKIWYEAGSERDFYRHMTTPFLMQLLHPVFTHASELQIDPRPLVEWLLQSHFTLSPDVTSLSLSELRIKDQDAVLQVLTANEKLPIDFLQVQISRNISLTTVLPQRITRLDLDILDRISPEVVPSIIKSLPHLSTISITMKDGLPNDVEEPRSACTRHPARIPTAQRNPESDIEGLMIACTRRQIKLGALVIRLRVIPLDIDETEVEVSELLLEIMSWLEGKHDIVLVMVLYASWARITQCPWTYLLRDDEKYVDPRSYFNLQS